MSKKKVTSDEVYDRIDLYLEEMDSVDMLRLYSFIVCDYVTTADVEWD